MKKLYTFLVVKNGTGYTQTQLSKSKELAEKYMRRMFTKAQGYTEWRFISEQET